MGVRKRVGSINHLYVNKIASRMKTLQGGVINHRWAFQQAAETESTKSLLGEDHFRQSLIRSAWLGLPFFRDRVSSPPNPERLR
jgi:hypothetical protein